MKLETHGKPNNHSADGFLAALAMGFSKSATRFQNNESNEQRMS